MKKVKNIRQRYVFQKFEKNKLILKAIYNNLKLTTKIRWKSQQEVIDFEKRSSLTQIKNICVLTGRSRSVHRLGNISRLMFRQLASNKSLPGIFKYSW
jgi:small subunit ribosomal protein S14